MEEKKYFYQFSRLKDFNLVKNQQAYERFVSEINGTFSVAHWKSVCAVTLTLKHGIESVGGHWERLDEIKAAKNFRRFMHGLNRATYKNAVKRYGKRVRVIPSIEKEAEGRLHIHAAIEKPQHVTEEEFEALIERCWSETTWGYKKNSVEFNADQGWIDYMLKPSQKSGLEDWADCIDWSSFHNPDR